GSRQDFFLPVLFPRVDVRDVDDAVAAAILQGIAVDDAGQVVGPVQTTDRNDIFRAGFANGIEQRLHAHGDITGLLLGVFLRVHIRVPVFLEVATVAPDLP